MIQTRYSVSSARIAIVLVCFVPSLTSCHEKRQLPYILDESALAVLTHLGVAYFDVFQLIL